MAISLLVACFNFGSTTAQELQTCQPQELDEIKSIVSSEELILALTPRLKALNRAAMNLKIPSGEADRLFTEDALCNKVGVRVIGDYSVLTAKLYSTDETKPVRDGVWSNLLNRFKYFEKAKFYFVEAQLNKEEWKLNCTLGFKGTAIDGRGYPSSINAKINVIWNDVNKIESAQISNWETQNSLITHRKEKLFRDVTQDVISNQALADELARSRHEEITLSLIRGESVKRREDDTYPFFFPEVTLEHPAVSIVDIDRDGFDDFFLSRQHLPSLMFRNNGDGTFDEIGESIGLRLPHDCTCSLFADYDNDGDSDVFIGRARNRARYFENRDGKFVDKTEQIFSGNLPFMTSSISAADYDNDGLLDVYFSTYSPIEGSHGIVRDGENRVWPTQFLSANEREEFRRRKAASTPFIDVPGPPNLLLKNDGRTFSIANCNDNITSWRKTFQSMWFDCDSDGDQDLYVCNDFAPDDLFRNEGGAAFVRVNEELGLNQLGFGMGVSCQDFDADGDLDLYVSNMYSKAGTRITRQVSGINPLLSQMAAGNYLYQFRDGSFDLASARGAMHEAVSVTGWSWGGRMVDINNDRNHEIFVANGYYSAPGSVAEQTDL